MDKLKAIETFICVVDTGSFTSAANKLSSPKARISQRISDLESALGVRLLHRTTRTLALTAEGQQYYEQSHVILKELATLERKLGDTHSTPKGQINIDSLVLFAKTILLPNLANFQQLFPEVYLNINCNDKMTNLLEDGIDCSIRGGILEDSSYIARQLGQVRMGLYASPEYLQHTPPIQTPEDLKQHQLVSWSNIKGRKIVWGLQHDQSVYEFHGIAHTHIAQQDMAITAAINGLGICPAPPFAVLEEVRLGQLKPVIPRWHFPTKPIHLVYPSKQHVSARVRCFVDWVVELVETGDLLSLTPNQLAIMSK